MDILQMSFSASVMIVAVVMIRAITLHRLPKRTFLALWGVVICRLLIPFSIPYRFSFYSGLELVKQLLSAQTATSVVSAPVVITGVTNIAELPATGEVMPSVPAATATISPIFIAWLVGMFVCALIFITAYLKCRREFKTSLPVQNDFAMRWLREHALRRTVQIRQSDRIQAPLTYGVFQPVILLPKAIDWTDEAGLKVILAHELTHIRRFDTLLKLVLAAAVCVHWFNPFVWVMYALANRDIELACDEAVVRALGVNMKSAYALTLIDLEEKKSSLAPLISGFARNAIEERITAIMKIKKRSLWGIMLALALVIGTVTIFATNSASAVDENSVDASGAVEQLLDSIRYADGELSFQIPKNYPDAQKWNILISGRKEQDGFGMSVHYLTEENENKSWEAGKRYTIPSKGTAEGFTELWLEVSLPDKDGNIVDRLVDLMKFITSPSSSVTTVTPDGNPDVNNEVAGLLGNDGWVWPVEGCDTVASMFGKRVHPISGTTIESDHICISGDNVDGAKVYAALSGTVLETGFNTEQGNYIIITHNNGIETSYRHLKEILVSDGDPVAAGGTIGTVGKTGTATGPCLGFCVYVNGTAVNPLNYFSSVPAAVRETEAVIPSARTSGKTVVPAEPVTNEALPEYWEIGALNIDGVPYLPLGKTAEDLGYTVNVSSFKIADEVPDWNPQYPDAVEYNYEMTKDGKSLGIASLDISDGTVVASMIDGIYCNTHDQKTHTSIVLQDDTVYMPAQFFKEALDTENILP